MGTANDQPAGSTTHAPGFPRITFTPGVMGGKACIRNLRVTVSTVLGMLANHQHHEVLALYPYLEAEDLKEVLAYAAWRLGEGEAVLRPAG